MMNWNCYVSRPREIFLDLDSRKAVTIAWHRLRRSMNQRIIPAKEEPLIYHSNAKDNKYHMIIRLTEDRPAEWRALQALHLGSDISKAMYTLERIRLGVYGADLLFVLGKPYPAMREPDAVCHCPEKHNRDRITKHCPVLRDLQGDQAGAQYFSINNDRKDRTKPLRITVNGPVPWSQIMKY